jgi:NAD(P)-dependent dehydrogenase (short-subunit alcohol dehydrogenase family)
MTHPVLKPGNVALATGSSSGIGLAAARAFAQAGMSVVLADIAEDRLDEARAGLVAEGISEDRLLAVTTDVSSMASLEGLRDMVLARFGKVHLLMNNAGIQPGSALFGAQENWDRVLGVNLMGVINGSRVFGPSMLAHGEQGLIINTGSKQGITTPPGDPAYNVAKAGVKAFTEALEHELRNIEGGNVRAHLLIPGFVFTPLTANGRTEKPAAAWTPEQTVEFMLDSIGRGNFYILCPDNDVPRELDEKRIRWAAGDITENRPPLSRWHKDYAEAFADYLKQ